MIEQQVINLELLGEYGEDTGKLITKACRKKSEY